VRAGGAYLEAHTPTRKWSGQQAADQHSPLPELHNIRGPLMEALAPLTDTGAARRDATEEATTLVARTGMDDATKTVQVTAHSRHTATSSCVRRRNEAILARTRVSSFGSSPAGVGAFAGGTDTLGSPSGPRLQHRWTAPKLFDWSPDFAIPPLTTSRQAACGG
jgi:hypothetical protein